MGTTVFMIIDRETVQETIYAPRTPVYEAAAPPRMIPTPEKPLTAAKEELPAGAGDWKTYKIPSRHLVLAALSLAVFFIVSLSFFSLFKAEKLEIAVKAPHEHIEDALLHFHGVRYSFNPASGKLFLAGHILSAVDYQEMRYNLSLVSDISCVEDNVVIDEYVCKAMGDVVAGNGSWRGVTISAPKPGEFVARGYVQGVEQHAQLADYLNVNFPYPDRLQNKVVVEDALNVQIQNLIQGKGFSGIAFQAFAGDLMLLGRYSEKKESEFEKLLVDLKKIDGILSVKNFAVPSLPSQASIDLTQQYRVTGSSLYDNRGYSAIINGRIFTLGDLLDGMKITTIELNSILLEKDGLKYKIDYTR
jgi:type III secretion system YscD/HrpQ family protein